MDALSTPLPWNTIAEGYAETTMKLFSSYIETALDLLEITEGDSVADIACGPGTLAIAAAARGARVDALDFSPVMITTLLNTIKGRGLSGIEATVGDGQNLPYMRESFDAAFSMFGLMFFPDRPAGHSELFRVLKPGGRVCVSSWAPVAQSSLMQTLFSTLQVVNPNMPDPEADMSSLENPDVLEAEMTAAGFEDITIHTVTESSQIASGLSFWDDMTRGAAPVRMMMDSLSDLAQAEASRAAIAYLNQTLAPFPAELSMTAWVGTGRKPG